MTQIDSHAEPAAAIAKRREPRSWSWSFAEVAPAALASDLLSILLTSIVSGAVYHAFAFDTLGDPVEFASLGALTAALILPVFYLRGLYQPAKLLAGHLQIASITVIWIAVFLFLSLLAFGFKSGASFSRGSVFLFFSAGLGSLVGQRYLWKKLLASALANGMLHAKKVIVIGDQATLEKGTYHAKLKQHAIEIVRRFPLFDAAGLADGKGAQDAAEEILGFIRGTHVHEIFIIGTWAQWDQVKMLLSRLRAVPLPVQFLPDGSLAELVRRPLSLIGATPALELQRAPLDNFERGLKRTMDVLLAGFSILALSPVLILAALAVRLDSRGPIIFRQTRLGFNGIPFEIYKFRSMTVLENGQSIVQATRNDRRVTRVGRWLRRTSIDELPQLFNVMKGDMSLVGPRPHAVAHDSHYHNLIANYAYRQHVKPGITGWAQVNGCRGETATVDLMERRVELDLWYVANWSAWLDLKILARTAAELTLKHDVY